MQKQNKLYGALSENDFGCPNNTGRQRPTAAPVKDEWSPQSNGMLRCKSNSCIRNFFFKVGAVGINCRTIEVKTTLSVETFHRERNIEKKKLEEEPTMNAVRNSRSTCSAPAPAGNFPSFRPKSSATSVRIPAAQTDTQCPTSPAIPTDAGGGRNSGTSARSPQHISSPFSNPSASTYARFDLVI